MIEKTFADLQSELASLIQRNTQTEQKLKDAQEEEQENKAKLIIVQSELKKTDKKLTTTQTELEETKTELEETKTKLSDLDVRFTKELSERDKQIEFLMNYVRSQQNNNNAGAASKEPNQGTGLHSTGEAPRELGQNQNAGPGFFDRSDKAQVPSVSLESLASESKTGQPSVEVSGNSAVLGAPK